MLYRNGLFLAIILVTGGVWTCPSVAAPSVKKLGGTIVGNFKSGTPTTINTRAPSLRTINSTTKSASLSNNSKSNTKPSPKTSSSVDSARLPGLHGNLIKGMGSKLSANYASPTNGGGTSDLAQRIDNLEKEIISKQETLESGNGISINGTTISLSEEIASLPERLEEINKEIEDLDEKIDAAGLSGDYYTIDETQAYLQQNYYTKPYLDQIISQLSNANVVDQFDPSFLHQGQNQEPKAQP